MRTKNVEQKIAVEIEPRKKVNFFSKNIIEIGYGCGLCDIINRHSAMWYILFTAFCIFSTHMVIANSLSHIFSFQNYKIWKCLLCGGCSNNNFIIAHWPINVSLRTRNKRNEKRLVNIYSKWNFTFFIMALILYIFLKI